MSYIDKNLLPDETIIFRTKKHHIIFLYPVILTLFFIYASIYMQTNPILVHLIFAPWLVAAIFWASVGLEYLTSEFVVTDKRILMREGFFYRHTNETRLSAISQITVEQNILGQLLNYGTLSLHAFGAFDAFTVVAKPGVFQQAVNQQVDRVSR